VIERNRSESGRKAHATIRSKFGDEWLKNRASKGGKKKVVKGFAVSGLAREAGKKGGTTSRGGGRPKKLNERVEENGTN
jgi:hypothetical protein